MEFYNSHDGVRRISADHATTGALSVDSRKNAITFVKTSSSNKRKCAFTLAEVLITLGIIGIIAAMTLPSLIEKHQKKVVVTRLQKFYTNINQAIKLSEVDNGPAEYWVLGTDGQQSGLDFYNKYLAKYLKTVSNTGLLTFNVYDNDGVQTGTRTVNVVYFADGSAMRFDISSGGMSINFFINARKLTTSNLKLGKDCFHFCFRKKNTVGSQNTIEPYTYKWDGTREHLFSHERYGCRKNASGTFCAKLIQYDGWEIKDDYPW